MFLPIELDRFSWTGDVRTPHVPIILTGDFNSKAESSLFTFMEYGSCEYRGISRNPEGQGLISPELGITDGCQHFDLINSRDVPKNRLYHSERQTDLDNITPVDMGPLYGSGILFHEFGFKSAYNPFVRPRGVTTRQNQYVMVDYIFYSRRYSQYLSKFIESNLKLLGRLCLYTEKECIAMGHLPNNVCPSDHLSLVAKFLLTQKK